MHTRGFWRERVHWYRLWIFERRSTPVADPLPAPSDVSLRRLDRHQRRDWVTQRTADRDWPQYRVALENDHELILAERGGEVLGWAWIGYGRVFLAPLGRAIRLSDGTGYLYDAYVRPAERGRGIGRALVAARVARAEARGTVRLLSHVRIGNAVSRRALEHEGFSIIGETVFMRALALCLWTREPLPAPRAA